VAVIGSTLAVAWQRQGLSLYGLSEPAMPEEVGGVALPSGWKATEVASAARRLHVRAEKGTSRRVFVIDAADVAAPALVGQYDGIPVGSPFARRAGGYLLVPGRHGFTVHEARAVP
jgi:hypothetical protein